MSSQAHPKRWPITFAVMLVAMIEVLDMTIVAVALPHMMGSLSTNTEQISWIITAYIVSSAIGMLLVGYFTDTIGQRRLLIWNISAFILCSCLAGMATSLWFIVLCRILQGAVGSIFVPMSKNILREVFPPEKQGFASSVWVAGVMLAPIFGPTIGGYITETLNWRWIFFINFPLCLCALIMVWRYVPESKRVARKFDLKGLILLILGVSCLQLFIDRGNNLNWFHSTIITSLCLVSCISLTALIYHSLNDDQPIIRIRIFGDRNYRYAWLLFAIYATFMFGNINLQALYIEQMYHYPPLLTGLLLAPRGLISGLCMVLVGRFYQKINPHYTMWLGLLFSALGTYFFSTLSLQSSETNFYLPILLQGLGLGLFMVPISTQCFVTVTPEHMAESSGLFSFGRSLGVAIGIAIFTTLLSRESQLNWHQYGAHISLFNPNLTHWTLLTQQSLQHPSTIALLAQQVGQNALFTAYHDAFYGFTWIFVLLTPMVLLVSTKR